MYQKMHLLQFLNLEKLGMLFDRREYHDGLDTVFYRLNRNQLRNS